MPCLWRCVIKSLVMWYNCPAVTDLQPFRIMMVIYGCLCSGVLCSLWTVMPDLRPSCCYLTAHQRDCVLVGQEVASVILTTWQIARCLFLWECGKQINLFFLQQTFWLSTVGKAQVSLIALTEAPFYSSVPVSRDGVTMREHAQHQDREIKETKWNSSIITFIIRLIQDELLLTWKADESSESNLQSSQTSQQPPECAQEVKETFISQNTISLIYSVNLR